MDHKNYISNYIIGDRLFTLFRPAIDTSLRAILLSSAKGDLQFKSFIPFVRKNWRKVANASISSKKSAGRWTMLVLTSHLLWQFSRNDGFRPPCARVHTALIWVRVTDFYSTVARVKKGRFYEPRAGWGQRVAASAFLTRNPSVRRTSKTFGSLLLIENCNHFFASNTIGKAWSNFMKILTLWKSNSLFIHITLSHLGQTNENQTAQHWPDKHYSNVSCNFCMK